MRVLALVSFDRDGMLDPSSSRVLDAALRFAGESGLETVAAAIGDAARSESLSSSGADRNVLLSDPGFGGSDTGAAARIFAAFMGDGDWAAFSWDCALTGYLSGMLGVPHLNGLASFENGVGVFLNDGFSFEREMDGPCCVCVLDSVPWPPREAKKRIAAVMGCSDLGLGRLSVGTEGSLTVCDEVGKIPPNAYSPRGFLGVGP